MTYSDDRCLKCSNPGAPYYRVPSTDYWYCSQECYEEAFGKYLDKDYALGKDPTKTPEYKELFDAAVANLAEIDNTERWSKDRVYIEEYAKHGKVYVPEATRNVTEYINQWEQNQQDLIADAKKKLERRVQNEFAHAAIKEAEKQIIEDEKQIEKLRKEREKTAENIRRLEAEEETEKARLEMLEPKPIPEKIRLEHTHILGPSGSGKTTLLQETIMLDIFKTQRDPRAYIIIDPKGLMIDRLSKLEMLLGSTRRNIPNRCVLIDPLDAPALNLFQTMGRDPAQLISDFGYIFSTTNQKLTGKQSPCFSFCARLLFTLPHANLFTLLDLLDDRTHKKPPNPVFQETIPKLQPAARRFFENDFYGANYASTREEIKARIWGVLESDTLAAMLNAHTRQLDIGKCIQERKILLVNTRMTQLKEAHQTLGRYIIALTLDAIQSRKERHPVYLVIDEFQEFADAQKTPQMLRLLREYGGGAVIAHQNMYCTELDDAIRNAISTNTSIKYASSPEGQDLNYMARDLRCDADWLKSIHKSNTHARFACFVRGMHPPLQHPFIEESEFGRIERDWSRVSEADYQAFRNMNKASLRDDKTHEGSTGIELQCELQSSHGAEAHKPIVPPKDIDSAAPTKWIRPK